MVDSCRRVGRYVLGKALANDMKRAWKTRCRWFDSAAGTIELIKDLTGFVDVRLDTKKRARLFHWSFVILIGLAERQLRHGFRGFRLDSPIPHRSEDSGRR